MKFYYTDYYELEEDTINKMIEELKDGIEFDILFEDYVGCDHQAHLVYDQVKEYIESLLKSTKNKNQGRS